MHRRTLRDLLPIWAFFLLAIAVLVADFALLFPRPTSASDVFPLALGLLASNLAATEILVQVYFDEDAAWVQIPAGLSFPLTIAGSLVRLANGNDSLPEQTTAFTVAVCVVLFLCGIFALTNNCDKPRRPLIEEVGTDALEEGQAGASNSVQGNPSESNDPGLAQHLEQASEAVTGMLGDLKKKWSDSPPGYESVPATEH
ncbi:hypothetical protein JCM10207_002020 [Rhodosporidiobolus poonsookiae]